MVLCPHNLYSRGEGDITTQCDHESDFFKMCVLGRYTWVKESSLKEVTIKMRIKGCVKILKVRGFGGGVQPKQNN